MNLDQVHHIRHNWLIPSFFVLEIVTQKDCLSCYIQALKVSLSLKLIQKGGLCSLRLLPLMTEFSNSGRSTREQLARERFFEGLQSYKRNENKIILGDFNFTLAKMERDGGNKTHTSFMHCQKSSQIVDSRIYGVGRTQIPLGSPATIDLLVQDSG